ncbi:hypothetical protein B7494_g3476 [Chlorociboria aeruginascens]|nr:hypothetical protein B7494_g3476 [Chlorociboria aeruginascens]
MLIQSEPKSDGIWNRKMQKWILPTVFSIVIIWFIRTAFYHRGVDVLSSSTIALSNSSHSTFTIEDGILPANVTTSKKAAVIVETRRSGNIVPLILHFSAVLGPSWPIIIYTSAENFGSFSTSSALLRHQQDGRIIVRPLAEGVYFSNWDSVSAFLTRRWIWEDLAPAEHILVFQSDSILCANAARSVDDFFEYDLIGAPIDPHWGVGYNGGLCLRKRSTILRVLDEWDWDQHSHPHPEDQWYFARFKDLQDREIEEGNEDGIKLPSMEIARTFAVETIDYPHPLGLHQPTRFLANHMVSLDEWCPEYQLARTDRIHTMLTQRSWIAFVAILIVIWVVYLTPSHHFYGSPKDNINKPVPSLNGILPPTHHLHSWIDIIKGVPENVPTSHHDGDAKAGILDDEVSQPVEVEPSAIAEPESTESTPIESLTPSHAHNTSILESSQPPAQIPTSLPVPLTTSPLTALCSSITWTPGLWLQCHSYCGKNDTSICGGLNNARNRIQTCLRLAIDSGAGLILPKVTRRNPANLGQINTHEEVCPDFFWDIKYLTQTLGEQCPQLEFRFCGDISGIEEDRILATPNRPYISEKYHTDTFREMVLARVDEASIPHTSISPSSPVAISFGDPYIGWNYTLSRELSTIRKSLFKSLRFNHALLDISSKIQSAPELKNGFFGVHLRGERDWPAQFGTVDQQMDHYIKSIEQVQTALEEPLKTVYVSCGDQGAIEWLRQRLEPMGYIVHDKWTLLSEDKNQEILQQIEEFGFDQKAIVEYQTLVGADYWMGVVMSSMSSLIAFARTVDDEEDFFTTYVFPDSTREGLRRTYGGEVPGMRGDGKTFVMVVNEVDIMDSFP